MMLMESKEVQELLKVAKTGNQMMIRQYLLGDSLIPDTNYDYK